MTTLYRREHANLNQHLCPYFSVGQTLGGGLERTRAGWLSGEGDGGRAITEE